MIIERAWRKYFCPDNSTSLVNWEWIGIKNNNLIPYDLYILYGETANIQNLIDDIANLKNQIDNIKHLQYPAWAIDEIKTAIDLYNIEKNVEIAKLIADKEDREELFNKLTK